MANFDVNVQVNVLTENPPAGVASFTTALIAGIGDWAGSAVRSYESASDVNADSDLKYPMVQALLAAFQQSPSPAIVKAGRMSADVAPSVDWSIEDGGGTSDGGDSFKIWYNDIEIEYVSPIAQNEDAIATGLRNAANTALAAEPVTVSGATNHVILTADTTSDPFLYDHLFDGSGDADFDARVVVSGYIPANIDDKLDALVSDDSDWYGFSIDSRVNADLDAAAAWAELQIPKKMFIGQSSDADVLAGTAGAVTVDLKALGYEQSAILWKSNDAEQAAFAWLAKTLSADPDVETTIWAYKTLDGIISDETKVSTTEKNQVLDDYGSLFLPFKSTPVTGMGRSASGLPLDIIVTLNWVEARIQEAIVAQLIAYSNRNEKIPYTDIGISVMQATVEEVLANGVEAGHFEENSTEVTVPLLEDVSAADKTARLLRMRFVATAAGAIETVRVTGYILID